MRVRAVVLAILTVFTVGASRPALAQDPGQAVKRPVIRAVPAPANLTVDGRLDEPIYAEVAPFSDFIQMEPHEGEAPTEKTEVWVLFGRQNVYVAARMWDNAPDRMLANDMRRDASDVYATNETFSVSFDTFNDKRTGVYFMTNMLGALRDAQVVNERTLNSDWNPIWNPQARRFENGWAVEIEIPFKSLRYPAAGEQDWGIQMRRVVRWKNEIVHLTRIPASAAAFGIMRMSEAAVLQGLEAPEEGHNLEVKPYATSRVATDRIVRPATSNDLDADAGFDVKYGLKEGLTADFTYNTDFGQVEDDQQQVNLTRFGLFFPEKRDFFLEGQGIFSFGSGGGDIPSVFFSRQIGLSRGLAVPIRAGGRLTGKVGGFSVGLLDIQTAESAAALAPSTNFAVARVQRDIFGKSRIGFIATQRTPENARNNTAVGADANLVFGLTTLNSYYARTHTPGRPGDDVSYYGLADYNGDRWGANVDHATVQPNFNPEVGFLRRPDFRRYAASARFSPRPQKRFTAVRKFFYTGSFEYYTNNRNVLESRDASLGFQAQMQNQDSYQVTTSRSREVLDAPFRIAPAVTIPVGGYTFQNVRFSYSPGPRYRLRGTFSYDTGSFYDGDRQVAGYSGRLDITTQLALEPSVSLNWVQLPHGDFHSHVISTRTLYMLSPRSWAAALVQYNSLAHTFSTNLRFRWEYVPGSDFFIVFNEGRYTDPLEANRLTELQNRTFVVKITRLFRY